MDWLEYNGYIVVLWLLVAICFCVLLWFVSYRVGDKTQQTLQPRTRCVYDLVDKYSTDKECNCEK